MPPPPSLYLLPFPSPVSHLCLWLFLSDRPDLALDLDGAVQVRARLPSESGAEAADGAAREARLDLEDGRRRHHRRRPGPPGGQLLRRISRGSVTAVAVVLMHTRHIHADRT